MNAGHDLDLAQPADVPATCLIVDGGVDRSRADQPRDLCRARRPRCASISRCSAVDPPHESPAALVTIVCARRACCAASPLPAATAVTFRASDGVTPQRGMDATAERPAPAVLLVHSLSRTHQDWDATAEALTSAGFGVLALDLRGHGASVGGYGSLQSMLLDVQAALAWLKTRHEVNASRIGIARNAFRRDARRAGRWQRRFGALDCAPVARERVSRPAVRAGDAIVRRAIRSGVSRCRQAAIPTPRDRAKQLGEITPGVREVRIIDETAANGRALFSAAPDLTAALVDWFRKTLL